MHYGLKANPQQESLVLIARLEGLQEALDACQKKDPSSVSYWKGDRWVRKIIMDIKDTQKVLTQHNKEKARLNRMQSSKSLPVFKLEMPNQNKRKIMPSVPEESE